MISRISPLLLLFFANTVFGDAIVFNGSTSTECKPGHNDHASEAAIYMMSRIYKNSGVPVSTFSTDGKIHCVANHSKSEYTWIKSINGIQIQSEKTTTHTTPFRSENTGYSDLANELANRTFNPSIASKSALETEILSRFSTASFLKNKKLDLYIIDHGGTNTAGENYYSSTFGNSRISGSDIGEKISKTNEGTFRVILDNCYSGKGIENILSKIMNKMQKNKNFTVCGISSAGESETSSSTGLSKFNYYISKTKYSGKRSPSLLDLYSEATKDLQYTSLPQLMSNYIVYNWAGAKLINMQPKNIANCDASCRLKWFGMEVTDHGKLLRELTHVTKDTFGIFDCPADRTSMLKYIKKYLDPFPQLKKIIAAAGNNKIPGWIDDQSQRESRLSDLKDSYLKDAKTLNALMVELFKKIRIKTKEAQPLRNKGGIPPGMEHDINENTARGRAYAENSRKYNTIMKEVETLRRQYQENQKAFYLNYSKFRNLQKFYKTQKLYFGALAMQSKANCNEIRFFNRMRACEAETRP